MNEHDPEFLATYGPWNVESFLRCAPAAECALLLVEVETDARDEAARETTNDVVHRLWADMLAALPGCAGHRYSWAWAAFLVPASELEHAQRVCNNASNGVATHRVRACGVAVSSDAAERRAAIRALEEQLEEGRGIRPSIKL